MARCKRLDEQSEGLSFRPRINAISLPSGQSVDLRRFAPTSSCLVAGNRSPRDSPRKFEIEASCQTQWQNWQGWQAPGSSAQSSQLDDQQSPKMTSNSTQQRDKEREQHDDNLKKHFARLQSGTGTNVESSFGSRTEGVNTINGTIMRGPANHPTSSKRVMGIPQETSSKPRQATKISRAEGSVSIELQYSRLPPRVSPPIPISQFQISKSRHVGLTSATEEFVLSRTEQMLANEGNSSLLMPGNPGRTPWTDSLASGHAVPSSHRKLSDGNAAQVLHKKLENLSMEWRSNEDRNEG
ncbi:hypothetical protein EYC80_002295 [Monilinia laxa]|uniref:Uncharacterized protein n=1 Tax=Monilinia laxa TaxID=61186 RepID=A0A5N6K3G8_MONLA|nr:hypothetical protein EYC80_002295 [Monilinia laxa]